MLPSFAFYVYLPESFRCLSGNCIANSRVCDGYNDCDDGTDELACGEYGKSAESTAILFDNFDNYDTTAFANVNVVN